MKKYKMINKIIKSYIRLILEKSNKIDMKVEHLKQDVSTILDLLVENGVVVEYKFTDTKLFAGSITPNMYKFSLCYNVWDSETIHSLDFLATI